MTRFFRSWLTTNRSVQNFLPCCLIFNVQLDQTPKTPPPWATYCVFYMCAHGGCARAYIYIYIYIYIHACQLMLACVCVCVYVWPLVWWEGEGALKLSKWTIQTMKCVKPKRDRFIVFLLFQNSTESVLTADFSVCEKSSGESVLHWVLKRPHPDQTYAQVCHVFTQ
jgi:hypothetical protein